MDEVRLANWFQEHALAIFAVGTTLVLIYHYLIERSRGVKLSKKYRNSIFEAQSKIFLNATQYLISGNRDLAIKEFLNAVDLNRETLDTYFALGGLFRSNGEIEKAISIHRSLIARENITESTRLQALKELAVDFDRGGFVDKAIETYKDVLKINSDQFDVIQALCRIYENIEDWDQAYTYRIRLSKVGHVNQAETISHILVQKAKAAFQKGNFQDCNEDLEDALRFSPSVSAKILKIQLLLIKGDLEELQGNFIELLKEHPVFATFAFVSLDDYKGPQEHRDHYFERLSHLKQLFMASDDEDFSRSPSVVLSRVRLLKGENRLEEAYSIMRDLLEKDPQASEVMHAEYIKLLIDLRRNEEAINVMKGFVNELHNSLTRHYCSQCGFDSDEIFWRCPQCYEWETIKFRWKV